MVVRFELEIPSLGIICDAKQVPLLRIFSRNLMTIKDSYNLFWVHFDFLHNYIDQRYVQEKSDLLIISEWCLVNNGTGA